MASTRSGHRMLTDWLDERFFNEFEAKSKDEVYAKLKTGVPLIAGTYCTCASTPFIH